MADGFLSERNYAILLGAVILSLFTMVVWSTWRHNDAVVERYEREKQVLHLQDLCKQNPDGSAICEPGAFGTIPTTTVAVQGAK